MYRPWIIAIVLVIATVAVYAQVAGHEFIRLDDDRYVTRNAQVQEGLTPEGVRWAFTSFHASNWHPLTWLSHMLDAELYGLDPRGHHLTNLLLHLLNMLLLFVILRTTTGADWPAAWVAGMFALHPLHVESVAWVAERKDLLSTCFGLLAIATWVAWTRKGGALRYAGALLLFAASLASKPMLVTLPLLLLLFDVWPLGRLGDGPAGERPRSRAWVRRVVEKLPLFGLSLASAAVTLSAQSGGGAVSAGSDLSLALRSANAVVSCVRYLGKMCLPVDLSVLYPHPNMPGGTPWSAWQVIGAALLLVAITVVVARSGRDYAKFGWAWYLISLLPVIGLVQVGSQAMADRYTYVPLIGPLVLIAWGVREFADGPDARPALRIALGSLATVSLLLAAGMTQRQAALWKDSRTLFEASLAAAPGSPTLQNDLGIALAQAGDEEAAVAAFTEAIRIVPDYPEAQFNLGASLVRLRRFDEAVAPLRRVVRKFPDHPHAHNELAIALTRTGRLAEAAVHYREAVRIVPDWIAPMNAAAWILATHPDASVRDAPAAQGLARRAAELTGGRDAAVLDSLAAALAAQGQYEAATQVASRAVQVAEAAGETRMAARVRARLELYRRGQPYVGGAGGG